jgi:hypothetical protein
MLTAHDGFTLADVVSYAERYNHANGENGQDGHHENYSDNMGHEGPTGDPKIAAARARRRRNMMATLLLSQGTPMILGGDEIGRSQRGNNNAYNQDNPDLMGRLGGGRPRLPRLHRAHGRVPEGAPDPAPEALPPLARTRDRRARGPVLVARGRGAHAHRRLDRPLAPARRGRDAHGLRHPSYATLDSAIFSC